MKFNLLVLGALASSVSATDKVLKVPLTKVKHSDSTQASRLIKRDGTLSDTLVDDYYSYFANVQVGTPGQTIRVLVDTGSSDLWFPTNKNPNCPEGTSTPVNGGYYEDTNYCLASAQFDTEASSTWKPDYSKPDFSINYVDHGYAKGVWGTDTVQWNGATINNMYLAAANDTTKTAILGIGREADESSTWTKNGFYYPNWPVRLQTDGYIAKASYSLYTVDDPYTTDGDLQTTLLFGGIDNAKYTGSLATFSMASNSDLAINVTSMVIHVDGQATTLSTGATTFKGVLDSGTTYQVLPTSVTRGIATAIGSSGSTDQNGFYIIPCNGYSSSDYISYRFGSKHIHVPISAVIYRDNNNQCTLRIHGSDTTRPFLGDSFLINAYVFYDLHDKQISIAQVRYTSEENIQAVS